MAAAAVGNSSVGVLALLEEEDNTLKTHALQQLHTVVDRYWAEIADSVPLIESLSDDDSFPNKELAAAVASKCFFHLEEYDDALRLALGAGKYFDINARDQYTDTIIATCIDEYISLRTKSDDDEDITEKEMDPRLEAIVERMFERCYVCGEFKQALGIALEALRLDQVKEALKRSADVHSALSYAFDLCRSVVTSRDFRLQVVQIMVDVHLEQPSKDLAAVCQCLQLLNNPEKVSSILLDLIKSGNQHDLLVAYQIAFDLSENENQNFLLRVHRLLSPSSSEETKEEESPEMEKLKSILSGEFVVDLQLDFLHRQSHSDPLLMKTIKDAVENRNSVLHHAAVLSHGYLNAGTTDDSFLRNNLEWLGKASNWAKFTATASLGVVHKGHVRESMNLLAPYLPQGGVSSSPYSEGGALYAMGLIHANKGLAGERGKTTMEYLRNALRNSGSDETVQHGACLGIGLCGLASHDLAVYDELKNVMFTDNAVAGEGAGIGVGLLMLGCGNQQEQYASIITDLLAYTHDTKHEKIIRGAMMAIAFMMYETEEVADDLIEQLLRDKDPLVRYGGVYVTAMAYVGTSNNSAVRRLLHIAVSDVADDVRRAAVTCLGFVLFRTPVQVPKLVSLLAESFNPHVRYGSCIAVGMACAGTAKNEALQLLEPLLDDAVDYVRQGALMATAMVLMEESEARSSKVSAFRKRLLNLISDKHVTTMTKMGAILAQGILDAGGRNVVISMQSHTGFTKMAGVVGLALWAQHWFWYPLFHFLELSFSPSMSVGLNKDLKLPKDFSLTCHAKPSHFAPPKMMEEKKEEKKELVAQAVLSTTAKAKAREAKKQQDDKEDVEMKEEEPEKTEEPVVEKKEPNSFSFTTPVRVTPAQESVVTFDTDQRYAPVLGLHSQRPAGVIMLEDKTPDKEEDVEEVQKPTAAGTEEEADPPEPFEWTLPPSSTQ